LLNLNVYHAVTDNMANILDFGYSDPTGKITEIYSQNKYKLSRKLN